MTTFETNGHVPSAEGSARQAYDQISAVRDLPGEQLFDQPPLFIGDQEIQRVDRHPEDPLGALQRFAAEVCDPEQIRVNAVEVGKTSQAVRPEEFDPLVLGALTGISRTREGAILGPAQAEIGKRLEISLTTDKDVERIVRERAADGIKADMLEARELPRLEQEVEVRKAEVREAEEAAVAAADQVRALRPAGIAADDRPGSLMAWVRFSPLAALTLAVVAMVINTVVLQPEVANLVNTSEPGTYLLAAGLSLTFELASAAAGFALASIRLPGRIVGAFFVGVFGLIMVKLVTGLDALREGQQTGVLTLTAATLASCYVAALAGCTVASWHDFAMRRELIVKAGTALADALDARAAAQALVAKAREKLAAAESAVKRLRQEILQLRDSAARADAAALEREAQGARAEVEAGTVRAFAETHVSQEGAAVRWAYALAKLMHRKTRAEKLPKDWEVRPVVETSQQTSEAGLTGLQKAAIACLGLGALAGVIGAFTNLIAGVIVMGVAAGLASALLLVGSWRPGRRARAGGGAVTDTAPPPIDSPADQENPLYREQPSYMVAKYRSGGPAGGERQ